ncbi:MAG TPA: hypothetical protein VK469_21990 [Candidatus Kapabacteria bacterium]|nr:hypothetical protein [Candidatus Kapabacteria bacterium]
MGKLRTKMKKKVNPLKTNKMIYAVAGGLALLAIAFLLVTISKDKLTDKPQLMEKTLKYLKNSDGVMELKILPVENKVIIIYDPNTKNKDFAKVVRYAGIKLSNKVTDQEITIILSANKVENIVYTVVFKNGEIVSEKT